MRSGLPHVHSMVWTRVVFIVPPIPGEPVHEVAFSRPSGPSHGVGGRAQDHPRHQGRLGIRRPVLTAKTGMGLKRNTKPVFKLE